MTKIDTIRFLKKEELNILKYDELIKNSTAISVYCYSWYLDAVSDYWGAIVKGDYDSVFPICFTVKFGQNIIYQPFFTREIGLFCENEDAINAYIKVIPNSFKKIDFSLKSKHSLEGFNRIEIVNQELYLNNTYKEVYSGYSKNAKRLINKAIKANYIIKPSQDVASFISFFKEFTGPQVNYSDYNYHKLRDLLITILKKETGILYQVLDGEDIVAQGVYLIQEHRITYLKGSTNQHGKKNGAMFFLMDEVIRKYANQDKVLDFGGSKIDSIATFYKKFGAKDRVYYNYSKNEQSWLLKKGKKLRDLLKK